MKYRASASPGTPLPEALAALVSGQLAPATLSEARYVRCGLVRDDLPHDIRDHFPEPVVNLVSSDPPNRAVAIQHATVHFAPAPPAVVGPGQEGTYRACPARRPRLRALLT